MNMIEPFGRYDRSQKILTASTVRTNRNMNDSDEERNCDHIISYVNNGIEEIPSEILNGMFPVAIGSRKSQRLSISERW